MNATDLAERVQRKLAERPQVGGPTDIARLIRDEAGVISDAEVLDVLRRIRDDSTGAGKLEQVLATPGVTDVLVNGAREVWFDRGEGLERANVSFDSDAEVRQLATRLAVACGRRLDDAQPFADGRLHRPDGSSIRVHALLSPPADGGTCISLRVLRQAVTSLDGLVERGTMSAEIAEVLGRIVRAKRSFLVVGGTGSGKTTLLGALLAEVPHNERIICIEDTAELHPPHPHVVNLVARARNVEGHGEITMTDLLRQALRMRPDRIVVGEIRGGEVVDLLAALNTGHDGGAGTVHANSLREIPARMEALAALGGLDRVALHSQLSAAVDIVVSMRRASTGRQLHQIGIVAGNPVHVYTIWDCDRGTGPGFAEYMETLS
ncbi:TadA family conjugal transfer-associated ATPase [Corynebacterium canis]|uniref:TadA family conjugal transfer-associated ATPase n=1 Tax=Corynebacterium canis TaxID=679663 RepID=A0A5C5UG68_9CORY|nr:TadA family conjugal transfer-associated ATPase [Corynebacterium canis]TWT25661.1 TadA family conjugal transfer-associated ATPase [Corynebacterium canis]WJY74034.1 Putative conjugal transfer protein [Corynebacterium canis]